MARSRPRPRTAAAEATATVSNPVYDHQDLRPAPKRRRFFGHFRVLAPFLRRSRRALIAMVALTVIGGVAEATLLVVVARIAVVVTGIHTDPDLSVGPAHIHLPARVSGLLVVSIVVLVARLCAQLGATYLSARASTDTLAYLRTQTVGQFLRADWETQAAEPDGYVQDLVYTYVGRATSSIDVVSSASSSAVNFVTMVLAAFVVAPRTSGIVIAAVMAMFFAFRPLSRIARRIAGARARAGLEMARSIAQVVSQTLEIRTTNVTERVAADLDGQAERIRHLEFRSQLLSQWLGPIYQGLGLFALLVALWGLNVTGSPEAATLGAILLLLLRALSYGQTLQGTYHSLNELVPYAETLLDVQARFERAAVKSGDVRIERLGTLRLDHVVLEYAADNRALADVSIEIKSGEMLGIIGPSGAGKSSLIQILLGLRRPTSGVFLVDGVAQDDIDLDDWFSRVAFVPQEPRLLVGSVADNIRYWRDLSDSEVANAASRAHIHADIAGWADGFATAVGPRGTTLSGGQKQRIAIARALASHPSLLVLDEPTSALDLRSEALIEESLKLLRGSVTIIIIAHRMSTVAACDRLLVLNRGRVEALGTPAELAADSPFYREAMDRSMAKPDSGVALIGPATEDSG